MNLNLVNTINLLIVLFSFDQLYSQSLDIQYHCLNTNEKKKLIIDMCGNYSRSIEPDSVLRKKTLNFFLDTIINKDEINSAQASNMLFRHVRINEIDLTQKKKLYSICDQGYYNIDFIRFLGLLGDTYFICCLRQLATNNELNPFEKDCLIDVMARLGDKSALAFRLNYLKKAFLLENKKLDQEFAKQLSNSIYINRKEVYDILFDLFVKDGNKKQIILGDFGDGDEICCTLSSYSMEILSKMIINFPLERVVCDNNTEDLKQKTVNDWRSLNPDYKFYLWHPYYGINYNYWSKQNIEK